MKVDSFKTIYVGNGEIKITRYSHTTVRDYQAFSYYSEVGR